MADTGHDNWNGYTVGESEGKWSRVDSGLMKYERASPQTYGPPTSQAYKDGWERIFGKKADPLADVRADIDAAMGDDSEASCPTTTSEPS
jgi:hypothetical protein